MVEPNHSIIVGGGAAGCFAANVLVETAPRHRVTVLEKGPQLLAKVRISGGGRCNVTHACFDPRRLVEFYPRGGRELRGPFHVFQPRDTVAWFEARGVKLKTEPDGRMFPVTDASQTIIDCLMSHALRAGVRFQTEQEVTHADRKPGGGFQLIVNGVTMECERLLLATGGCRGRGAGEIAVSFGHSLEPPVPSLFTFQVATPWLRGLAGIAVEAEVRVPETPLKERGPVLLTHTGLSGPAVLRLSAWGARALHARDYVFPLRVNWVPALPLDGLRAELERRRQRWPAKRVANVPVPPLPTRLWEAITRSSGLREETRWAELSRADQHRLIQHLTATELEVTGKSLNKEEFVTCGGVSLKEVDFKTMESRICPGLYFAGEVLDIDGLTGGFNFQAAWTTGWIAGRSLAAATLQ